MVCLHLVERKNGRPGKDGAWRTGLEIMRLAKAHHRNQALLSVSGTRPPHSAVFLLYHYFGKSMAFSKEQCPPGVLASGQLKSHYLKEEKGRSPFMLPFNGPASSL